MSANRAPAGKEDDDEEEAMAMVQKQTWAQDVDEKSVLAFTGRGDTHTDRHTGRRKLSWWEGIYESIHLFMDTRM